MTTKERLILKLGSEEAYKAYMREIASRAGKLKVLKGWGARNQRIAMGLPVPPLKKST